MNQSSSIPLGLFIGTSLGMLAAAYMWFDGQNVGWMLVAYMIGGNIGMLSAICLDHRKQF